MNDKDHQEIEEGRKQFMHDLPYIIGIALIATWVITSLAKHYLH